ncbi:MAG: ABC transporter permease [Lachnospiraceae bacterium]
MRTLALAKRILMQILHDKRTMALILIAPLLVLGVIYLILGAEDTSYTIGVIDGDSEFIEELKENEDYDITVKKVKKADAKEQIKTDKMDGAVSFEDETVKLYLSGTDASVATKVQALVKAANASVQQDTLKEKIGKMVEIKETEYETEYVTGQEGESLFDKFGTQLIGIIVYFFVFLIAGINFLNERTSGTMEKLLSTPIRKYEIVFGYVLGFGVLAFVQAVCITLFVVYVLNLTVNGSIWYVLLISLLTAINALSLGILLSTIAHSEFEMMQFIPVIIFPQIFLCGLFRVSGIWKKAGYFVPLHYSSHALTEVMIKGNGFAQIQWDVALLFLLSVLFIALNVWILKKNAGRA